MTDNERAAAIEMFLAYNTDFAVQDEARVSEIKRKFLKDFGTDVTAKPHYVIQLLEAAYCEKNADDVSNALSITSMFSLSSKEYTGILLKLLEADWHYCHEGIAGIFQELKLPETVDCLYKTALTKFKYLDYDDCYALAVKCIWALGDVGTNEAKEKLKLLQQSDNEIISNNAKKQLDRT